MEMIINNEIKTVKEIKGIPNLLLKGVVLTTVYCEFPGMTIDREQALDIKSTAIATRKKITNAHAIINENFSRMTSFGTFRSKT